MMNASYSNVDEVDAGSMASSKASSMGVQMFGSQMVTDHTTAENDLKTLAGTVGVSIPQSPDSAHIAIKQTLMGLSGVVFDTTYLSGQVRDHQTTIQLFQNEINGGQDSMVKNYAAKYLPKLQMHLQMADSLRAIGK